MGQLTVTFSGVCTHFSEAVPGLHRVVLADASAFRFGVLQMPPTGEGAMYYLQPHVAIIQTSSDTTSPNPTVLNVIKDGSMYAGATLEVPNANGELKHEESYWNLLQSLSDFVPEFTYSADVVLNKRAMCYFDVKHGDVSAASAKGGAINAVITIETDGPPQLTLTPFQADIPPADLSSYLVIDSNGDAAITVANIEFDTDEDTPFDYILHYLTAQRGIPPALSSMTPGMSGWVKLTKPVLVGALDSLANKIESIEIIGATAEQVMNFNAALDVDPSCSDSRYP